jgi:hypothetical protein
MGFLHDFGLDELVPAIGELANELNGLKDDLMSGIKDDIITPISEDIAEVKGSVQDSAQSLMGGTTQPEE